MRIATTEAKNRAKRKNTCYKPAWIEQVRGERPCKAVTGGVQCWATSANQYGSCNNGRAGWLSPNPPESYPWSQGVMVPVYPNLPTLAGEPKPKKD